MLGYLLARSGVDVVLLEKYEDFFRDFRGDTIHPSTMEVLAELGLLEAFLRLPHNKTRQMTGYIGGEAIVVSDFSHLKVRCPYVAFLPQWDFLNFLVGEAKKHPSFRLLMEAEAFDLVREGDRVAGVRARRRGEELEIRAKLVVGADGRHSTLRERAGLEVTARSAPIDVLWFRLPSHQKDPEQSMGFVDRGKVLVALDRGDYWQCGLVIAKGGFEQTKERGLEAFRRDIAALAPFLEPGLPELKDWEKVKLLSVAVDRLKTWCLEGLLMIGDAAHAMSPIGGVGINLAIQDAVAASNVLVPAFRRGGPSLADLRAIQKRRALPTVLTQRMQVLAQDRILRPVLQGGGPVRAPRAIRLFNTFPALRRIPARIIGMGFRPEHVE
jgi:2-polyprenyl-6-methoxyphenol hydroxylase-like FAD-dependent oxidoreductase